MGFERGILSLVIAVALAGCFNTPDPNAPLFARDNTTQPNATAPTHGAAHDEGAHVAEHANETRANGSDARCGSPADARTNASEGRAAECARLPSRS